MIPLATTSDLEARVGGLSDEQTTRAGALLADASALVRRYCRQDFDPATGATAIVRPVGNTLTLPQRPVTTVTSVKAIGHNGQRITLSGWVWDGIDRIRVGGVGWRTAIDWDLEVGAGGWPAASYEVTYDHGYESVPEDIVAIVCGMVNRVLVAPSMVEGLQSERVGPFGYTLQQGAGTPGPAVRLTQADKDALVDAGYRRKAGTIQLRT